MIDIENQSDLIIPIELITTITKSMSKRNVELMVVNSEDIQKINMQYRQIDKPTDVLSFPLEEMPQAPLGTIIINAEYVKNSAASLGHSEKNEFCLLYIHGLLHLLGYDHEVDAGQMREKEKQLIQAYNLPKSLIIRTEEI